MKSKYHMVRFVAVAAVLVTGAPLWAMALADDAKPAPASPAAPAAPDAANLPSAESIRERYIEATGGKEAYAKIKNRKTTGTLEIKQQNIKAEMTSWHAQPSSMYVEMDIPNMGVFRSGVSGEVVWELNDIMGPRILEGAERATIMRSAYFDPEKARELFTSVETVGKEMLDGKPAFVVKATPIEGKPLMMYYDEESGLIVKTKTVMESQMGEMPVETFETDYREVDGIRMPFVTRVKLPIMEQVITMTAVEHNVDMPADRFDLPAEIKSLVEQKAADEAAKGEPAGSNAEAPKPNEPPAKDPPKQP